MNPELLEKYKSIFKATQEVSSLPPELAQAILSEVIRETIKKYQERVNVGIEDSVCDLIANFKKQTMDAVARFARWQPVRCEPDLFPRDCRFAYRFGSRQIFVIEQQPQVRTLNFSTRMTHGGQSLIYNRWHLALPYIVNLICFKEQEFAGMWVHWRTKPLTKIDDFLYMPMLGNLKADGNVCVGHIANSLEGSLSTKAECLVERFLSSNFNGDLNDYYHHGLSANRLTIEEWQQKSQEDSSFILGCKFKESASLKFLIDIIVRTEEPLDESRLRIHLSNEIDTTSSRLFSKIKQYFLDKKYESAYPKGIEKEFAKHLTNVSNQYVETVKVIESQLESLKHRLDQHAKIQPVSKSNTWTDYLGDDLDDLYLN